MRYYRYKPIWNAEETEALDPSYLINDDSKGIRFDHLFVIGDESNPKDAGCWYYISLESGEVDISLYKDFFLEEITPEQLVEGSIQG